LMCGGVGCEGGVVWHYRFEGWVWVLSWGVCGVCCGCGWGGGGLVC